MKTRIGLVGLLIVLMPAAWADETRYVCEHGVGFSVEYGGSAAGRALATLDIDGHTEVLQRMPSASGARYGNATTIFSTKGREAMLERRNLPPVRGCHVLGLAMIPREASVPPPAPSGPQVRGTLSYRERIALPADAVAVIQVQDVSHPDAPPALLAEKRIATEGAQVPIPFVVDVAPDLLRDRGRVVVTARIFSGGQLLFESAVAVPVLTQGHGSQVLLPMKRAE